MQVLRTLCTNVIFMLHCNIPLGQEKLVVITKVISLTSYTTLEVLSSLELLDMFILSFKDTN